MTLTLSKRTCWPKKVSTTFAFQALTGPIYSPSQQMPGGLAVHKQSFQSIAKCIAALTITCQNEGAAVVQQFVSDIKVSEPLTAAYLDRWGRAWPRIKKLVTCSVLLCTRGVGSECRCAVRGGIVSPCQLLWVAVVPSPSPPPVRVVWRSHTSAFD